LNSYNLLKIEELRAMCATSPSSIQETFIKHAKFPKKD